MTAREAEGCKTFCHQEQHPQENCKSSAASQTISCGRPVCSEQEALRAPGRRGKPPHLHLAEIEVSSSGLILGVLAALAKVAIDGLNACSLDACLVVARRTRGRTLTRVPTAPRKPSGGMSVVSGPPQVLFSQHLSACPPWSIRLACEVRATVYAQQVAIVTIKKSTWAQIQASQCQVRGVNPAEAEKSRRNVL